LYCPIWDSNTNFPKLYIPSQTPLDTNYVLSFRDEVKKNFRANRDATGQEQEILLSDAFSFCRQFNETFQNAFAKTPWWGCVPEPKFNSEPVVKLVPTSVGLRPGMILITHPLAEKPRTTKRSVWMILSVEKTVIAAVISEPKEQLTRQDKKIILTSKKELLKVSNFVSEGLFWGEAVSNLSPQEEDNYRHLDLIKRERSQLDLDIQHGYWFLATCPPNVLFKEKTPEFQDIEGSPLEFVGESGTLSEKTSPVEYDFTMDDSDMWKKVLQLMGGECELCVYCVEKPDDQQAREQQAKEQQAKE